MKKNKRMDIDEAVDFFQKQGVRCKKVEDDRPDCRDFIAIFGFGNLSREEVVKVLEENGLLCIFFEKSIREERRKKMIDQNSNAIQEQ